tara:strand:+ start:34213 stop:35580 length:1368 start_codon:yes stop_codon:yes gene_type:complete
MRTIAFSEIEAFPVANLVAKMEAGLLDAAPIWTNLKTFPWASFRGRVDILSGGYPCQPFSAAGKRLGTDDPRHLWPYIADGIRAMQPRCVFFENVEGHITLGLRAVLSELESIGYRTTWGIFSAAEVGAPHRRKRVFIMAHRKGAGLEGLNELQAGRSEPRWESPQSERSPGGHDSGSGGSELANPVHDGGRKSGIPCQRSDGTKSIGESGARRAWPSRPGEPQHDWEPPRVVASVDNTTGSRSRGKSGDVIHEGRETSNTGPEGISENAQREDGSPVSINQSASGDGEPPRVVANSLNEGSPCSRCEPQPESAVIESCDGGREEVVGNATEQRLSERGCGEIHRPGSVEKLKRPDQNVGDSSDEGYARTEGRSGSRKEGESNGYVAQPANEERRQAKPKMGGNPDGPSNRMGDAELFTTCDNRTDELRLLGNGVVPATAELAFRILSERLNQNP